MLPVFKKPCKVSPTTTHQEYNEEEESEAQYLAQIQVWKATTFPPGTRKAYLEREVELHKRTAWRAERKELKYLLGACEMGNMESV
jgi:hypothetical protein